MKYFLDETNLKLKHQGQFIELPYETFKSSFGLKVVLNFQKEALLNMMGLSRNKKDKCRADRFFGYVPFAENVTKAIDNVFDYKLGETFAIKCEDMVIIANLNETYTENYYVLNIQNVLSFYGKKVDSIYIKEEESHIINVSKIA